MKQDIIPFRAPSFTSGFVFMEISVVQAFHIYVCIVGFFLGGLPSESPSYLHVHRSPNHILSYLTHVTDHV